MPKKLFEKGNPGRPMGAKNKNYTNVNCWLELIWDRIPKMTFDQQVDNAWKAVNALLPKIPSLPATPGDSVNNATILQVLEDQRRSKETLQAQTNAVANDSNGVNPENGNGSAPTH